MFNCYTTIFDDIEQFATDPINAGLLVDLMWDGDINSITIDGIKYTKDDASKLKELIYKNRR